jgi:hypothetical protein
MTKVHRHVTRFVCDDRYLQLADVTPSTMMHGASLFR